MQLVRFASALLRGWWRVAVSDPPVHIQPWPSLPQLLHQPLKLIVLRAGVCANLQSFERTRGKTLAARCAGAAAGSGRSELLQQASELVEAECAAAEV